MSVKAELEHAVVKARDASANCHRCIAQEGKEHPDYVPLWMRDANAWELLASLATLELAKMERST